MGQRINYTLVGLFVILLSLAAVFGAYWLTIGEHQKTYYKYLVYTKESVAGLNEQAAVKYNGVPVGFVQSIDLDHDDPQRVIIALKIEWDVPITEATVATLQTTGITGMRYISLKSTKAKAPRLRAKPGERYPVIPDEPSLLVQIDAAVRDLANNINEISESFRAVFDKENTKNIKEALINIAAVTGTLKNNSAQIDTALKSANHFLQNASVASEQLPITMKQVRKTMVDVANTSRHIGAASREARLMMKESRSTFATLSQQTLPSAMELLERLKVLSTNMQQLTQQLNENPSILVRGKTPSPPGPGEHRS